MDFEDIRRHADRTVGDAEDWLRSDWTDQPTRRQVDALNEAAGHLSRARGALAGASEEPGERATRKASIPALPDSLEAATLAEAMQGWAPGEITEVFGR